MAVLLWTSHGLEALSTVCPTDVALVNGAIPKGLTPDQIALVLMSAVAHAAATRQIALAQDAVREMVVERMRKVGARG